MEFPTFDTYMLLANLTSYLSILLDQPIQSITPQSGGDISAAYKVETRSESFFLKMNGAPNARSMFETEKAGLEAIKETGAIKTPDVLLIGDFEGHTFLLMEYIESRRATNSDVRLFGRQLAELHQVTSDKFGWRMDNFIGKLHQSNQCHDNWAAFYLHERIEPQIRSAFDQGLLGVNDLPKEGNMVTVFDAFFEGVKPSLLHGDLWGGNYLISTIGTPYLIDPAVYFGHGEVDIAMSQLFGGFGSGFYETYHETLPIQEGFEERIQLYQWYYLLVHLNMFGKGYYEGVKRVMKKYFF